MKASYITISIAILLLLIFYSSQSYAQNNYSLFFNGNSSYLEVPDNDILSPTNLTVELWVKPTQVNFIRDQYIYKIIPSTPTETEWGIGVNSVGIFFFIGDELLEYTYTFPIINEWNHLAGTYDSSLGLMSLYLNGVLISSAIRTTSIVNTTGSMRIGWGQGPSYNAFEGYMDEIRISNVVRYDSDFCPLYPLPIDANTIALFRYNEGAGNFINDSSPNNLIGLISGASWSTDMPEFEYQFGCLLDEITSLVEEGVLNNGQGNSLSKKITGAMNKYNDSKYSSAVNKLKAFNNQVSAFVSGHLLTEEQASLLINLANNLIRSINLLKNSKSYELTGIDSYNLGSNYPNPFNPSTLINYYIPESGFVTLKVYDVIGKEVANLVSENKGQGSYNVTFDASSLPSGIYVYQLKVNSFIETKKMVLMK